MATAKLKAVAVNDAETRLTHSQVNDINDNIGKTRAFVDLIASVHDIGSLDKQTIGWAMAESLEYLDKVFSIVNGEKRS